MADLTQRQKTLSEMKDDVYFLVNEESDVFPGDKVRFALNAGFSLVHRHIHREPVLATFDTVLGTHIYAVPDVEQLNGQGLVDTVELYDSDEDEWVPLEGIDLVDVDTLADTAEPTGFAMSGNDLYLSPMPDAAYNVRVTYRPVFSPLVDDTDEVNLTDMEIDAAVFYACHLLKIQDEEFESAKNFKILFDEKMALASMIPTGVYAARQNPSYGGTI